MSVAVSYAISLPYLGTPPPFNCPPSGHLRINLAILSKKDTLHGLFSFGTRLKYRATSTTTSSTITTSSKKAAQRVLCGWVQGARVAKEERKK